MPGTAVLGLQIEPPSFSTLAICLVTEGTRTYWVMVCAGCIRLIMPPSGEASDPPVSGRSVRSAGVNVLIVQHGGIGHRIDLPTKQLAVKFLGASDVVRRDFKPDDAGWCLGGFLGFAHVLALLFCARCRPVSNMTN